MATWRSGASWLLLAAGALALALAIPALRLARPPHQHAAYRVIERLVDRVEPEPDPPADAAAYRWTAAEIDRDWSRASSATGVLLKSPSLTFEAPAESPGSIAVTLPASRQRVVLLWNDAPAFSRPELLRNRRELLPAATQPTRFVLRAEDIRADSRAPVRHLFLSVPAASRTSDVVGAIEVFRAADDRAEAGRIRLNDEGHLRDAIQTPGGRAVEIVTEVPPHATLAVSVRARQGSSRGRLSVTVNGAVTTAFEREVGDESWQDVRLPLSAGVSRIRFEAAEPATDEPTLKLRTTTAAVVWGSPAILARDSGDNRPNVILYVVDALRADRLGLYGARPSRSPFLDELGRDSAVFERAYAPASWTKPSVASLLTSLHPHTHTLGARLYTDLLPESVPTLQDALRAAGFVTALFSGNPLSAALSNLDQGFDDVWSPEAFGRSSTTKITAAVVNEKLLPWLDAHRGDRFFVYVQSMDPHGPLEKSDDPYGDGIAAADSELRRLYERLTALGLQRDTLLIVTSDHGEAFGEHGRTGHGQSVYEEEIRVPWLLHRRGVLPASRLATPVSGIDLLPTVLDLCGVPFDRREVQGVSRADSVSSAVSRRPSGPIFSTSFVYPEDTEIPDSNRVQATAVIDYPWKLVVTAGHKGEEPRVELYNLGADPGERRDVAAQEPTRVGALRGRLRTFLANQEEARRRFAARHGQDRTPRALGGDLLERLRALGYVR